MLETHRFLRSVIDTVTDHIVVIDGDGAIRFVNRSWIRFARSNGYPNADEWEGVNYLDACDRSASSGDGLGARAAEGIRRMLRKEKQSFGLDYPCHAPNVQRWFTMRVSSFELDGDPYFVISHQDITERKLAEEAVLNLSRTDGLTGVFNRRYFDEFLRNEWRRCARARLPISLAILDIDHFKVFNDTYGHLAGDDCLKRIAATLNTFARRPGDLCARYGGEEFAMIFGATDAETCVGFAEEMRESIQRLSIRHEKSPILPVVTASVGVATMYPGGTGDEGQLIEQADAMLYEAKQGGRNRVSFRSG